MMAQVPTISQWQEARPYLLNQRAVVEGDLRPLLAGHGAPFSICREVMSCIDHLGQLYTGSSQCGTRFREFTDHILGEVYPNYRRRAGELYQMYRCGTVHEFEPKVLENRRGQTMAWLCYQGNRIGQVWDLPEMVQLTVTHLEPVVYVAGRSFGLPVSTNCLIDDLVAAIDRFMAAGPEDERVTAWNRAARELAAPEPFEFTYP
jgi:hypothetical protein